MDFMKNKKNITEVFMKKRFWAIFCTVILSVVLAFTITGCTSSDETEDITEIPSEEITTEEDTNTTAIDIPGEGDTDKMVAVSVDSLGRANPFLPPGEMVVKVPQERLKYDVVPPSETPEPDMGAKKVASTKVSGIMYDKTSPSAILNVEGLDYLVRSGDVINGYKVLSIDKSIVTVQVGSNIYKAGVGQIIEESANLVNYNQIANLSKKFGGNK